MNFKPEVAGGRSDQDNRNTQTCNRSCCHEKAELYQRLECNKEELSKQQEQLLKHQTELQSALETVSRLQAMVDAQEQVIRRREDTLDELRAENDGLRQVHRKLDDRPRLSQQSLVGGVISLRAPQTENQMPKTQKRKRLSEGGRHQERAFQPIIILKTRLFEDRGLEIFSFDPHSQNPKLLPLLDIPANQLLVRRLQEGARECEAAQKGSVRKMYSLKRAGCFSRLISGEMTSLPAADTIRESKLVSWHGCRPCYVKGRPCFNLHERPGGEWCLVLLPLLQDSRIGIPFQNSKFFVRQNM